MSPHSPSQTPFAVLLGRARRRSNRHRRKLAAAALATALALFAAGVARADESLLSRLWTPEQTRVGAPAEAIPVRDKPQNAAPPAAAPSPPAGASPPDRRGSIRRVKPPAGEKIVALTFDLCEERGAVAGYDGAIVDALRAADVRATFFAGGKWMRSHPERTLQLMADPRFELGNHGWTHQNLRRASIDDARDQIVWTQRQYQLLRAELVRRAEAAGVPAELVAAAPAAPAAFRFPYGACRPETLELANDEGLAAVQWDVVSGDADPRVSPEAMRREVAQRVRPGSIVVFHANGRGVGTAKALPAIVSDLKAKGYRFVTVSELLRSGEVEAVDQCYELKPGDNLRYDSPPGPSGRRP